MPHKQQKKTAVGTGMKKTVAFVLLLFVVLFQPVYAQNALVMNTINKAKQLRNEKNFTEAARVLGRFEQKYPGNIWVEQLYAQTLFWMKEYRQAEIVYKRAIGFHPNNLGLKYDYAVMLFAENKLEAAKKQLQDYVRIKPEDAGVQALLGKIFYYQSQFKEAAKHLQQAVRLSPGDKKTEKLYREVFRIVSPQLSVTADYVNDDQPMQSLGSVLKFQWYLSDALDFDVSGNAVNYSGISYPGFITTAGAGNRFHFRKAGVELRLAGAWFYSNTSKAQDWGGTLSLDKKFGQFYRLSLEAKRTHYTYTIASVNNNLLMMNQYALNFAAGNSDGWNGMAGGRYQFFPDDNWVSAFYAWFLSKPLNLSGFKLAFGYAFNYMDSKEDRFEPKTGLQAGAGQNGASNSVEGVYIPYYTPHNQYANSVLVNFNYSFSSYAAVYGHASVGVYSKTYAPGYTLDGGTYTKTFAYQRYTPLDLGVSFQTDISRKAALSLGYTFLQTYYYKSHAVNFVFRYYF